MKQLAIIALGILIVFSIYFDITYGTLPFIKEQKLEAKTQQQSTEIPYFEKKVTPGDTVLSIIETKLNQSLSVSISEAIADFQQLNNGIEPEDIQIGRTYKFPSY
ncbi:hypothetical protein H1Z61_01480 [Bacillus aquiflavi]|uniref:LysM domain-containing protein n=1 Tax=Bacillus aquiflavi TaxID=2672567 RepID=A0A6B3VVA9_9BACI|nr:hypothetical protein [Bacillus aquiflavi]MBA4535840.1 hypothetical protein [Bacillus aquiflavi]NEY80215.1 hypothetical protein [Bacillus aquiflavi]UAC47266.1 hypothetical protein K6959_11075 [Bacillus aquiflavi]